MTAYDHKIRRGIYVDGLIVKFIIRIVQYPDPEHKMRHTELPNFLMPYKRIIIATIEKIIESDNY